MTSRDVGRFSLKRQEITTRSVVMDDSRGQLSIRTVLAGIFSILIAFLLGTEGS